MTGRPDASVQLIVQFRGPNQMETAVLASSSPPLVSDLLPSPWTFACRLRPGSKPLIQPLSFDLAEYDRRETVRIARP